MIESGSDDDSDSPPTPLKRRKLTKDASVPTPAPEGRTVRIKVGVRKPRPPAVVIEEPTEEELNALVTQPVESDNSSPGAEVNPQVIYWTLLII